MPSTNDTWREGAFYDTGGTGSRKETLVETHLSSPPDISIEFPRIWMATQTKELMYNVDGILSTVVTSFVEIFNDYAGKVSGSTVVNPHIYKRISATALTAPSGFTFEPPTPDYVSISTLNSTVDLETTTTNTNKAQVLFSFDLISMIERNIGTIPGANTAAKVTWLKANVRRIVCNWSGFGSSPAGTIAKVGLWNANLSQWLNTDGGWYGQNSTGSIALVQVFTTPSATVADSVDPNGFVHFQAYADASNGSTASTIRTDYVQIQVETNDTF